MDLMTDGQIISLLFIVAISFLAYRFKQPALSVVSGAGLFILAMQIYDPEAPDLLLMALMILMAIVQFVVVLSHSRGR